MSTNDAPGPIAAETDERHGEPRWLLVITLFFVLGVLLLLVFYANLPAFLS